MLPVAGSCECRSSQRGPCRWRLNAVHSRPTPPLDHLPPDWFMTAQCSSRHLSHLQIEAFAMKAQFMLYKSSFPVGWGGGPFWEMYPLYVSILKARVEIKVDQIVSSCEQRLHFVYLCTPMPNTQLLKKRLVDWVLITSARHYIQNHGCQTILMFQCSPLFLPLLVTGTHVIIFILPYFPLSFTYVRINCTICLVLKQI